MSEPKLQVDSTTSTATTSLKDHNSTTNTATSSNPNLPSNSTHPEKSPLQETLFLLPIHLAQLTTQAAACQALPLLPTLTAHFSLSSSSSSPSTATPWFLAAYSLTLGTFILISGRLGDLFGHKNLLIIGYLWFGVWSLACGFAGYLEGNGGVVVFDLCRAMQGVGPSLMLPNALGVLGRRYSPGRRKNMVFAVFGAMAPVGGVLGASFAAVFGELVWWPWAFWSLGGVCFAGAALAWGFIPGRERGEGEEEGFWGKMGKVDLVGSVVGVGGLILINVAWNQAPIVGWSTPYTYILLIIGVLLLSLFFYIELHIAACPLLPLRALKHCASSITFVLSIVACGWGCFGIWVMYTWQFHMELREASPLLTSAYMAPVAVTGAIAAIATGYLLGRIGPAWTMVAAMSAFVTGITLIATMPIDQTYWSQAFVCVLIITWGMDMSFPAGTVILSNAVGQGEQGVAASLVNTVVNYSISLGLGFAGTVEANVNKGGKTKEDLLRGYRAGLYVGVGLAVLGWCFSLVYLWVDYKGSKREKESREELAESGM